jgi:hypothetical protein
MKKACLLLLVIVFPLTGCAHRYVVVLNRGATITAKSKPRLNKENNCYVFKDSEGREQVIPAVSVREIAPAGMSRSGTVPPLETK